MLKKFLKLFWKRCHYCKQKREWFWYLWETRKYNADKKYTEEELEICTECASSDT